MFDELVTGEERHYGVDVTRYSWTAPPSRCRRRPPRRSYPAACFIGRSGTRSSTGPHQYVVEDRVTGALRAMSAADAAPFGGAGRRYRSCAGTSSGSLVGGPDRQTREPPSPFLRPSLPSYASSGPTGPVDALPDQRLQHGGRVRPGPVRRRIFQPDGCLPAWSASAFSTAIEQDIRPGPGRLGLRGEPCSAAFVGV